MKSLLEKSTMSLVTLCVPLFIMLTFSSYMTGVPSRIIAKEIFVMAKNDIPKIPQAIMHTLR